MNTLFNTKHYTYNIGTSLELNSCCLIYWYNSKTIRDIIENYNYSSNIKDGSEPIQIPKGWENLNLSVLQDFFDIIQKPLADNGMFSARTSPGPNNDFHLKGDEEDKSIEFDYIIYVSSDKTKALGFTYFVETQSNKRGGSEIKEMYFNFMFSIVNTKVDIKLSYTLDPLFSKEDPELQEYFVTSRNEVLSIGNNPKLDFMRYSDDILQIQSDDNYCGVTDSGAITRKDTWRFWIPPKIEMTRIKDFDYYSIGLYNGELMLYRWNSLGEYTIDYLTKSNYYGLMKNLKMDRIYLNDDEKIETMSGGVAVISKNNRIRCGYVSLFSQHRYINQERVMIVDPWENNDNVNIIKNNETASSLSLDLLCPPGRFFYLIEKRGPWYKFYNEKSEVICWSSILGSVYLKQNEEKNSFPINNRIIVSITDKAMKLYIMDYMGIEGRGTKEFLLDSDPSITLSSEYSENKQLIDSIRHRPLSSVNYIQPSYTDYYGYRGYIFYLSNERKILSYL